ncbi:MAG: chromosome segregation protein SMC, partial [Myxococcota bacterium]
MKIKRLEISGFKSFVDRTVVRFDHQVTAVVGPNGCGKSNIVDAIRWVMGEQSAKHLRGKAMDDVIFNGSESRGPHGFAEVSLTFDNTDGLTPPEYRDYAEITVSRRLDRQGRSDYLINKTPVRLMDVTNLFLGTGVGKRAYSIVEQGRIGFIVSSKPGDRRHLIEEAAGVTKFKARKKAAERKMDHTRQNLLRVSDIISEIERSLASLKRQAQKAERYKRYRSELRDLELHVAAFRWLELTGSHKVLRGELDRESAGSEGQRFALRVREAEMESERSELAQLERLVEVSQSKSYELDNSVQLLDSQIENHLDRLHALRETENQMERELAELAEHRSGLESEEKSLRVSLDDLEAQEQSAEAALSRELQELERRREGSAEAERTVSGARATLSECDTRIARAEAVVASFQRREEEDRARLGRFEQEREEVAARTVEAGQQYTTLEARLQGLSRGRAETRTHRETIEAELEALRSQIAESDTVVERLREEVAERRSRLRSLTEIQERFEGVDAGVRALMTRFREEGDHELIGLLADRIDCPPEYSRALAAALGERLQHVVVDGVSDGLSALRFLRDHEAGRATVIPRSGVVPRERAAAPEGVVGRLSELVGCADEDRTLIDELLGDVFVVPDLDNAMDNAAAGRALVTLTGELVAADGSMTGGAGDDARAHMLDVKREVRELQEVVARLTAQLEEATARHGQLRADIARRQAAIDAARTETHDAEISIVKAEKDLRRTEEERQSLERRASELDAEVRELRATLERANDEERSAQADIESSKAAREDAVAGLAAAEEVLRSRKESVEEQSARATEVRVIAAQAKERAEGDRAAVERLRVTIEELVGRRDRLLGDLRQSAAQQGRLLGGLVVGREERQLIVAQASNAREALTELRGRYEARRDATSEQEHGLKELRAILDAVGQRIQDLTLREREATLALEHLEETILDRHRVGLPLVISDYHAREIPDEAVEARVSELNRLIERMGEINLTAIEEYEEKSERYDYLTSQRKDI